MRGLIYLGLVLIAPGTLRAQRSGRSPSDTAEARRTALAIEQQIGDANLTCDYKLFARVEAPDFIFTDARGAVTNRAEDLAGESSCRPRKGSYILDEVRFQLHGDVAVFNARA